MPAGDLMRDTLEAAIAGGMGKKRFDGRRADRAEVRALGRA